MKKPAFAGFWFETRRQENSEHPEKHQQQDHGDGYTEQPGNDGHGFLLMAGLEAIPL
jgi:hypothetical protein